MKTIMGAAKGERAMEMFVRLSTLSALTIISITNFGCASAASSSTSEESLPAPSVEKKSGKSFSGNISWYGAQFQGKKTASGEIFDMNKKTAAHKTLPFATKVLVEDPKTGQSVVVKVNDRGPFVKSRVMDISRGGAVTLGTIHKGVCAVDCTVLGKE